jgi:hypothetical protein
MTTSFHVLIATVGKKCIFNQLDSLVNQLTQTDYLTIVFDNIDIDNVFDKVSSYPFHCKYNVIMETKQYGAFGHGIRNKYNTLEGNFILHADDDDFYAEDAFEKIREICIDNETLYIFQMDRYVNDKYQIIPDFNSLPIIRNANIGTPCGVIPIGINNKSIWGRGYGGDGLFYTSIQQYAKNIEYIDTIIYHYDYKNCWTKNTLKNEIVGISTI